MASEPGENMPKANTWASDYIWTNCAEARPCLAYIPILSTGPKTCLPGLVLIRKSKARPMFRIRYGLTFIRACPLKCGCCRTYILEFEIFIGGNVAQTTTLWPLDTDR